MVARRLHWIPTPYNLIMTAYDGSPFMGTFDVDKLLVDNSTTLIGKKCDELKNLLISKNLKYGDSALKPARIFSTASSIEQIKVRIDDKINRIKNSGVLCSDEDTVMDLAGYLILLRIALDELDNKNQPEYTIDPENPRF